MQNVFLLLKRSVVKSANVHEVRTTTSQYNDLDTGRGVFLWVESADEAFTKYSFLSKCG